MSADPDVLPSGERAAMIVCPDAASTRRCAAALRADPPPHLQDLVPAETTVLVVLREGGRLPEVDPVDLVRTHLAGLAAAWTDTGADDGATPGGETVTLPVDYRGADLTDLASTLGLTPDEVVEAHTREEWEVAFGGFAPGFGYLTPLRGIWTWDVARRDSPRPSVPAGSVAVAGRYGGVYPRESPGGWMLLGRLDPGTAPDLFDPDREPAALLRPGVRVRFVRPEDAP